MKEGHLNGHWKVILAVVMATLPAVGVWGDSQRRDGIREEQIKTLEKRQEEDRRTASRDKRDLTDKVERIDSNVTQIRIILEGMKQQERR